MAKTQRKDTGEAPREISGAPDLNTSGSPQSEPTVPAAFEGPTSDEAARSGETEAGDAWAPQSTGDTTAAAPERGRIAERAYQLYQERGGSGGDAIDDWLAAEREFTKKDTDGSRSRE
jgi:hypothetical protein